MNPARQISTPTRRVLRHHGRSASNVLLLHGTIAGRDQMARQFHFAGPAARSLYLRLDCTTEQDRLREVMRAWIVEDGRSEEPAALIGDGRGTLFLDAVEALSVDCQQLLLMFLERLAEASTSGHGRPIGRVIAGSRTDLFAEVVAGRFMPQLYDALDKARVDLQLVRGPK